MLATSPGGREPSSPMKFLLVFRGVLLQVRDLSCLFSPSVSFSTKALPVRVLSGLRSLGKAVC